MKISINTAFKLSLLSCLMSSAYASGYKMEFQSASILADSGEAAAVEDAGTNWYNSAGLVYLPQQIAISGIGILTRTTFNGSAAAPSPFSPLLNYSASGAAYSNPNVFVPAVHYTLPIRDKLAFGISVVPAWGFTEDYGNNSMLRYDLTKVSTKTIDIAPSLAMKVNDKWSFGLGPDFNYFAVQSAFHVLTQGPALFGGTTNDSVSRFSANNWGYGWHAGVLFRPTVATRVGLNYRSKIVMHLKGYSDFDLNGLSSYESNQFRVGIPLPPTTTVSIYQDINPRLALLGTVAYDQWSILKAYNAQNYIQPPTLANPSGLVNVSLPQKMSNTFDFSVGTHYQLNEKWMLRGSVKFEPTPTNNQFRDINFPDGDKLGFQIGSRYQINSKVALDLIYGHVFVKTVKINPPANPLTGATVDGHISTHIDLVGAQIVWNI